MKRKITVKGFLNSETIAHELSKVNVEEFVDVEMLHCEQTIADWLKSKPSVDVLVIEVDANDADLVADLSIELQEVDKATAAIVLLKDGHADQVRQLMRTGIHDVFLLPGNIQELREEISEIVQEKQKKLQSITSQVICFLNAKGGAGSSTLAVATGYSLCAKYDARVCILDLDLQLGDIAHFLDVENDKNIRRVIEQPERIDATYLKALMAHHPSGLDVLPSPSDLMDVENISPVTISMIIDAVCEIYDFVIVDIPSYFSPWTLEAMRKADRNFLVTQRSLSMVRNARLILDKLMDLSIDTTRFEIINNRDSKKTGIVSHKQMLEVLKHGQMFNIHNDYSLVVESQETGKPISKLALASSVNRDIEALAKAIYSNENAKEEGGFMKKHFLKG